LNFAGPSSSVELVRISFCARKSRVLEGREPYRRH